MASDPFLLPEEATAAEAIARVAEDLELFDDWMDRYQFIIEMSRKLPSFPGTWADDLHRVPGCQSRVWMEVIERNGKLYLAAASDAAIVSGLIALLLRVYSGRSPEEILATDPVFLKDLGLLEALSTNRGNGIAAMARKVQEVAAIPESAGPEVSPGTRVALFLASVFAANAVSTYMPLWFADRGLTPAAIGQVLSFASLFKVLAGPGWGTLADRLGRRRPVMIAAAVAVTMSLAFIPFHGFTRILLVAAIQGVAASALGPLADSLALALMRELEQHPPSMEPFGEELRMGQQPRLAGRRCG